MGIEGGKHGFGLTEVMDRLHKYQQEYSIDLRANEISRRINSYKSLAEAKQEFNQGMNIYKKLFLISRLQFSSH